MYVAAESDDTVSLLNFDGNNLSEIERIVVGSYPTENEGPHGLTVDPNGKYCCMVRKQKYYPNTDGLTGGVHNVFIDNNHVYAL